ncbi:hypothetical protein EDB89DRAFT_1911435, partial [Lactarius sanguifluus]
STVLASNMSSPESPNDDIPLTKNLRARVLYEATLQELMQARSYVVTQLLREHNDLLDERSKLTGEEIDYSPMNFLHPPPPLLPYLTTGSGHILQRRISCPLLAWFPKDRRRFEVGTQMVESRDVNELSPNESLASVVSVLKFGTKFSIIYYITRIWLAVRDSESSYARVLLSGSCRVIVVIVVVVVGGCLVVAPLLCHPSSWSMGISELPVVVIESSKVSPPPAAILLSLLVVVSWFRLLPAVGVVQLGIVVVVAPVLQRASPRARPLQKVWERLLPTPLVCDSMDTWLFTPLPWPRPRWR